MTEIFAQRDMSGLPRDVLGVLRDVGWLEETVLEAGRAGKAADAMLRADLGRGPVNVGVGARVHLEVGEPVSLHDRTVVPLTWEAAGFPGLFPVMDAVVEVRRRGRSGSHVLFWGRYDPPLGRLGELLDRAIAHEVAEATVEHLLDLFEGHLSASPEERAASS